MPISPRTMEQMPILELRGKSFVHAHHLSVPFRDLRLTGQPMLLLTEK
jgi:hypothetical protein